MVEAAEVGPGDRVLEIGTGSGYGAAVLSRVAGEVWTVERHGTLADAARDRAGGLGYDNAHVRAGDGTLGWPEAAPSTPSSSPPAGRPCPQALVEQLADGGRLVIPVGPETRAQHLVRVRRRGDELDRGGPRAGAVRPPRSAPRGGPAADHGRDAARPPAAPHDRADPGSGRRCTGSAALVAESARAVRLDRRGRPRAAARADRRLLGGAARRGVARHLGVLPRCGPASPGSSSRARGSRVVAVEADWPDAARIDALRPPPTAVAAALRPPSRRFPTWMWRNREVRRVRRLAARRTTPASSDPGRGSASTASTSTASTRPATPCWPTSTGSIPRGGRRPRPLRVPDALGARSGPVRAGRRHRRVPRAARTGWWRTLTDLLQAPAGLRRGRRDAFVEAAQNAAVVANAERYYRVMYHGSRASWNLRDQHMFETLQLVRAHRGPGAKVVVWEHNSHIGDASATEMGARGEHNVGQLCRRRVRRRRLPGRLRHRPRHGRGARRTGVGRCSARPSGRRTPDSYERICHDTGVPAFLLHLREPDAARGARGAGGTPARAGHRRDLPARDRAAEPLLPGRRCPTSSTSTSGSTRPRPSPPGRPPPGRAPTPTPSASDTPPAVTPADAQAVRNGPGRRATQPITWVIASRS